MTAEWGRVIDFKQRYVQISLLKLFALIFYTTSTSCKANQLITLGLIQFTNKILDEHGVISLLSSVFGCRVLAMESAGKQDASQIWVVGFPLDSFKAALCAVVLLIFFALIFNTSSRIRFRLRGSRSGGLSEVENQNAYPARPLLSHLFKPAPRLIFASIWICSDLFKRKPKRDARSKAVYSASREVAGHPDSPVFWVRFFLK